MTDQLRYKSSVRGDRLRYAVGNCIEFARQYSYFLATKEYLPTLRNNLLIYMYNNFLDMTVLTWYHAFGSRNDYLHFRRVAEDPDKFKHQLLQTVGMNDREWNDYREGMKNYRNRRIAHFEVDLTLKYPELETASRSMAFYYSEFIGELKAYFGYETLPDSLSRYSDKYRSLANDQVRIVHDALLNNSRGR